MAPSRQDLSKGTDGDLPGPSGSKWQVRSESGQTFGPVDLVTLQNWARDGRLAPTHELSADGEQWQPVSQFAFLQMDWVAEVTPGAFYGPIHRDALRELIFEGSVNRDAAVFRRDGAEPSEAGEDVKTLRNRIEEQRREFDAVLEAQDQEVLKLKRDVDEAQAALRARELEFEAERQESRASEARHKADLLKRDALLATLQKENEELRQSQKGRHALEMRIADLERTLTGARQQAEREAQRVREALDAKVKRAVEAARKAESEASRMRADCQSLQEACDRANETCRRFRLRDQSVRKLLQQALAAGGPDEEVEVIEATVQEHSSGHGASASGARAKTEPSATHDRQASSPGSLAQIEAQAQQELLRLHRSGAPLHPQ